MINELTDLDMRRALPLTGPLGFHLSCRAVLAGVSPGRCLVDDPADPASALVLSPEACFLCGRADNGEFLLSLRQVLFETRELGVPASTMAFVVSSTSWAESLDRLCRPQTLARVPRLHYLCTKSTLSPDTLAVDGAVCRRLDAGLLAGEQPPAPDHLQGWIRNNWRTPERFLAEGFGFATLLDGQIASWSLADCVYAGECEIGIRTAGPWRWRGLAAMTAAAATRHALDSGSEAVGWHCDKANVGSWRTAGKVGFQLEREYAMFVLQGEAPIP